MSSSNTQSTFKQPTLQRLERATKRRVTRDDAQVPILIPQVLYNAIRMSCVVNALDENKSNRLNEHQKPITVSHDRKGSKDIFVYYSSKLLKSWLRFLTTLHFWCDIVEVPKVVKTKFGSAVASTTETIRVRCLRLPLDSELAETYRDNQEAQNKTAAVRNVIKSVLLNDDTITLARNILVGHLGDPSRVSSPSNICRVSRLDSIGLMRITVAPGDHKRWEDFYRSEMARVAYVHNVSSATRVSDSVLLGLTGSEAEEYNKQTVANAAALLRTKTKDEEILRDAVNIRTKGSAVNPALVHLYDTASRAKVARDENKSNPADVYKAMVKTYYTLTGHKLDHKSERKNGTYDLRMADIRWAEDLRKKDPIYTFTHFDVTDRIRAMEGILHESVKHTESKDTKIREKSVKMMPVSNKYLFAESHMYSTSKPKSSVAPDSKVHDEIAKRFHEDDDTEKFPDEDVSEDEEEVDDDELPQDTDDVAEEEEYYGSE
jgi:hypothetical protein